MIVIIDYGMGNLKSIVNAMERLGIDTIISSDLNVIEKADGIILPGVGAFGDAMVNVDNFKEVIRKKANNKCPILGICLGMQMLYEKSFEGGETNGLGLLKGEIDKINPIEYAKVPHTGWNSLDINHKELIIKNIKDTSFMYFVHSYYAKEIENDTLVASSKYGGIRIPAIVKKDNIIGMQFHPEKSGVDGLTLLKNFGVMVNENNSSNRYN